MRLSVIIPTLDEEQTLGRALTTIPRSAEVVVSDGLSRDRTSLIALEQGARLVTGSPGRSMQMNRGARVATGDVFLFLHSDCELPPEADDAIRRGLAGPRTVGGSFRLRIASPRRSLGWLAAGSNFRARYLGLPYGDQAIFVRRSVFEQVGGYPEVPLMEDVELVRRAKRQGRMVALSEAVTTGARHWERLGPLGTTLVNWAAITLFFAGVAPERLAPLYWWLRGSAPSSRSRKPVAVSNQ